MKIRLVCTLWGDSFVDLFLRLSVRSLLAPGNAADLARGRPVRLSIVTTRKDEASLRASPSFGRLAAALPVDFTTVGRLDADLSDPTSHAMLWRAALEEARRRGETVVFVIPDVLIPRDTLTRWVERLEAGAAAVFSPALQVVCETALAELEQRFPDAALPLDLDAAAAGALGLRHLHPHWIAHVRGSPRASFHPEYLMRTVGRGVNMRLLALFPFCIDPSRAGIYAGGDRVPAVPIAWDPFSVLSLEPACKQLERNFRGAPLDRDGLTGLSGWYDESSAVEHPAIGVDFTVSADASSDRALRASSHAASFFVTQARLSRRIHRVWRAMHRLGCRDAARVLATAHFVLPLRRRWRHRGPVTVLVPRAAMGDAAATAAAVREALAIGHERALTALIDAHVVLGDVALRSGVSYVQIESAADLPAAGGGVGDRFTTAAGVTFAAAPESPSSSSAPPASAPTSPAAVSFRVLSEVVADGISVYAIDRILPAAQAPDTGGWRAGVGAGARRREKAKMPPPLAVHPKETSEAIEPWLERLRRRAADARQGAKRHRLSTVGRWVYRQVLVSRPPFSRRLRIRMTRRGLGDADRRRLVEAFTILGLADLGQMAAFHGSLGVHGIGAPPLTLELQRIADAFPVEAADAERRFREVVAAKPDVAEAWLGLGYLAADRGDVAAAVDCFDRAAAGRPYVVPGNATVLPGAVAASAKGRLLEQAGRLTEAEAAYASAIALGAKNDVCRRYARLLRARGAADEASVQFDRAVPWDGRAHPFPPLPRLLGDVVRVFQR